MIDNLRQIIKEEAVKLPKEAQEVINAFDFGKVSEEIGKKYSLDENEITALQTEITLILMGMVDQSFFVKNIENNVGTSKDEAEKIAEEINQKIFDPMFDKLTENIKSGLKNRNIHWQQNLDFILSGGNYTAFIKRVNTQQRIPNEETTFNPSKIDDLKSKFTI